ncbi:hypothetical protein PCANC_25496 [Puccinia coronata f. sp. avenae]|uniref:Amidohydrolase 3 domain-containing protein n=1 Tax=Puccinia coronata f. sp. avenae TaxID=200324 RepID=A0A2N5RYU3_9BASI|nr:hypothetical protein PCANC_25496 [Puccinia coronata f. sp. avenae]
MASAGRVHTSQKLRKELAETDEDGTRRGSKLERPCVCGRQNLAWMAIAFLLAYLTYYVRPVRHYSYAVCVSSGGTIYTAEPDSPFAECIAITGSHISFVGKRADLENLRAQSAGWLGRFQSLLTFSRSGITDTRIAINTLDGDLSILPGLIDAHAHPLEYGEASMGVDLVGCKSVQSVIARIISHISLESAEPSGIIRGSGWDQNLFEGKQFPSAIALSSHPELQGKKIVLRRIDYHAYWVSEAILDSILTENLAQDVEGGKIVRDRNGRPTGVFIDNAMDLIDEILPKRTDEDRFKYLESTAKEMLAVGLTTVNDAATDLETVEFYKKLDAQDKLPVRVTGMVNCGYTYCGDQVEKVSGNKFNLRSVKLFVDGALGSWGAALWEPYSDLSSSRGILRAPEEVFPPLIQQWVDAGFQVNSHAIGDRANTLVIDSYEQVLRNLSYKSTHSPRPFNFLRLRIEHAQILRQIDMERMGKMGIIASVQPTHAIADMDYAEDRLGSERIRGAYAWNSLLKQNVTLALGSDFPVSAVSPFLGIHAAYTRRKPDLSYEDEGQGCLRVGKLADLVIINQNLFDDSLWYNLILLNPLPYMHDEITYHRT